MNKIFLVVALFTTLNVFASSGNEICQANGGQKINKINGAGKKYQLCVFSDNRQCTLHALKKGYCPVGGIKITGYDNEEQIYCAVNGGKIIAKPNAMCNLPNGKHISADKYYNQP